MKLLQWFLGTGAGGVLLVIFGLADRRDGIAIAGSIIIGAVAVSMAILASEK
jgi:hypothetical protein